jgi:hypothetical protein
MLSVTKYLIYTWDFTASLAQYKQIIYQLDFVQDFLVKQIETATFGLRQDSSLPSASLIRFQHMCIDTSLWTKPSRVVGLVSAPDVSIVNASNLLSELTLISSKVSYWADWSFQPQTIPTRSPIIWQRKGIKHHVSMYDQFMAPMYHRFSVDTLTGQTHKISGSKSHRILNFISRHLEVLRMEHASCQLSGT